MTLDDFIGKLVTIRKYFEINYVNVKENPDGSFSAYIRPSDIDAELDHIFFLKIGEYGQLINSYLQTDIDISEASFILLEEKSILEKILSLFNVYEVINYYRPIVVYDNIGMTTEPEVFNPDEAEKEYLFRHFVFRKDYIKQLIVCIDKGLLSIEKLNRNAVTVELVQVVKATKLMTEFTILLEEGVLNNEKLNLVQISAIRSRLFEALGLSDKDFVIYKNHMKDRLPDNRFRDLTTLITQVSPTIKKRRARKKPKNTQ